MAGLLIMLGVLVVAFGALVAPRRLGLAPRWLERGRGGLGEARYRASGVLAECSDWVLLGR